MIMINLSTIDFRHDERVAVFIDGSNFYTAVNAIGRKFDFEEFQLTLSAACNLRKINYYTAVITDENGVDRLRPLLDFLSYHGYNVVTKNGKTFTQKDGSISKKGNMDIEIALDFIETCQHGIDTIILATGDGDFTPLVKYAQNRNIRVAVMSSIKITPPIMSEELRKTADVFIEIADLIGE
jgi:uncharacterized LabA/DUF88 family protein